MARLCVLSILFTVILETGTVSADLTKVEIIPYPSVINKGATVNLNVYVTPVTEISGMQGFPGFSNDYLIFKDFENNISEGDLFNRNTSTYFAKMHNESSSRSVVFNVILGPYSQNTAGTYINASATGVKNGSVNVSMNNTFIPALIASPEATAVLFEVYTTKVVVTQPCDINGDLVCNIVDMTILNQNYGKNGSAMCPTIVDQRCDIKKDGIVNIIDKTILSQGYNKPIIQGQ